MYLYKVLPTKSVKKEHCSQRTMGAKVQDLEEVLRDAAGQLNQTVIQENGAHYVNTPNYNISYKRRETNSAQLTYKDTKVSITFYDSDPDPRISYSYEPKDHAAVLALIETIDTAIASMLKSQLRGRTPSKTDEKPVVTFFYLGSRKNQESKPFNGIARLIVEHAKAAPSYKKQK